MHILFFTDNFPPESNAPASRTYEHAMRWVRAGHAVTIVTCAPNFPQGKVYEGYRNRLWQNEYMDGIRVVRVWSYMAPNAGYARRIVDYLSFMVMAMLAAPFLPRPDVIVGTSPQFFTLVAAWWASLLKRRPWVLELRDIWPESLRAVGAGDRGIVLSALQKLEMFLYRRADRIVAVTNSFKRILVDRGVPAGKIAVVTNGVDLSRFAPQPKDDVLLRELELGGKFVVGYIGTHGMAHGLDTLLDAASALSVDPSQSHVVFLFVGDGARREELQAQASLRGLTNTRFLGPVPKREVARYWSLLDLSVIHLRRTELFATTIPSKLFECMGMGIPVALGVRGEALEILDRHASGEGFMPEDAGALVELITSLSRDRESLRRYRANGIAAAPYYDRETLAHAMLEELAIAAGDQRQG
ncbi:glycosyltransferase family 4 protein [Qipengyuania sediminis]|uniref:glycosyltransferase family 4 protein n=1 Tax=Qipengyuania sediminis TaxID=1532023 RepID=UPI001059AA8E|nr:glycosyltransferase family 4 protein [Qipengyuania sediminis]